MNYELREMLPEDESRVLEIFQQGIDSGIATFETTVPSDEVWDMDYLNDCRWVLENENRKVVGWCALRPVSRRESYKGVAEVSIYFDRDYQNRGLGAVLLKKVILDSEDHGFWTLQTNIFPENQGALKAHLKSGFHIVGTRNKIGKLNGEWKDVMMLERRSETVL